MLKRLLIVGGFGIIVVISFVAYSFLRTPEGASGPIEAIPLEPTQVPEGEAIVLEAPYPAENLGGDPYPAEDQPGGPEEATPVPETGVEAGTILFRIVQAQSQARFIIDEVLNGAPKTVVGVTDQVAAEIAVDFENPANSQVGAILINARDLTTDNDFRNRAIKNQILDTNTHEFISFTPTQITGLPESITIGAPYELQITGDLAIREVTQEVTFDVTVTPLSQNQLQVTGATTILYADFNIVIPQARSVTSVDDEVRLEIDFLAEGE